MNTNEHPVTTMNNLSGDWSKIATDPEKMEGLLGASGASLVYAGYPYDPFALDAPKS